MTPPNGHPKYTGPVLDAHCHFDVTTIVHAHRILDAGGVHASVSFWDAQWPPTVIADEDTVWKEHGQRVFRCHVPDLTVVGRPGSEQALADAVRDAAAAGAVGVKIWKNLGLWLTDTRGQRLSVDDTRLNGIWAAAAETGLPVVIHQGDTPAFFAPLDDTNPRLDELKSHPEWWYGGPEFPPLAQIHQELEAVVAGNPDTTFIGLHFGCFMSPREVARMLDAYANYHVDTAAVVADIGRPDVRDQVREIITTHPDRVIFGSDLIRTRAFDLPGPNGQWELQPSDSDQRWQVSEFFARHWAFFETADTGLPHPLPMQGNWTVTGLDLPEAVLRRFYWDNALRLFNLSALLPQLN